MHDNHTEGEEITVEGLIEEQRRLAGSSSHFEQVVGTLFVAGVLKRKLAALSDQALGHLMFEYVLDELGIFSPELTVCQVATERLTHSSPVLAKNVKEDFTR